MVILFYAVVDYRLVNVCRAHEYEGKSPAITVTVLSLEGFFAGKGRTSVISLNKLFCVIEEGACC